MKNYDSNRTIAQTHIDVRGDFSSIFQPTCGDVPDVQWTWVTCADWGDVQLNGLGVTCADWGDVQLNGLG
jgi:hypothetical protein